MVGGVCAGAVCVCETIGVRKTRNTETETRRRLSMSPPLASFAPVIRDVPVPRCPDSRIAAASLAFPHPFRTQWRFVEAPLPAYSGVTVWAFHPLRVVTGETSLSAREDTTPPPTYRGGGLGLGGYR